jgi:hypothetical protein
VDLFLEVTLPTMAGPDVFQFRSVLGDTIDPRGAALKLDFQSLIPYALQQTSTADFSLPLAQRALHHIMLVDHGLFFLGGLGEPVGKPSGRQPMRY